MKISTRFYYHEDFYEATYVTIMGNYCCPYSMDKSFHLLLKYRKWVYCKVEKDSNTLPGIRIYSTNMGAILLKFEMSKVYSLNLRNLKLGKRSFINWMTLDAFTGNLHTFEAVLKIGQILFWSISSKYLTVSILGSYLFFCFFIISYELYFCIFG